MCNMLREGNLEQAGRHRMFSVNRQNSFDCVQTKHGAIPNVLKCRNSIRRLKIDWSCPANQLYGISPGNDGIVN